MGVTKPIKNKEGKLKQFEVSDELPNQIDIYELRNIVTELAFELVNIGLIKNPKIMEFLIKYKK